MPCSDWEHLESDMAVSRTLGEKDAKEREAMFISKEIRNLKKGWDGYNADPPDAQSINNAEEFLRTLHDNKIMPSRIAPSVMGGIGVTFKYTNGKIYVEFIKNSMALIAVMDGVSPIAGSVTMQHLTSTRFLEIVKCHSLKISMKDIVCTG